MDISRAPPKKRFVQEMIRFALDDTYGYSQKPPSGRWGPDFDCTSIIYQAAHNAGYDIEVGPDKVRFSGTMLKDFEKAGFQILPFANVGVSDLKIGDILLNLALHAEVYIGEGQSIGALSSETGGFVGNAGDQTGHEIEMHPVGTFDKEWDYILRPPDDDDSDSNLEKEDDEDVPMYNQPYNQPGQGLNGMYSPTTYNPQGYPQGYGANQRMMPNQGYPQGNLGQMNGYSQANAGYPQQGMMQGYSQGNSMPMGPQGNTNQNGVVSEYCFVKGIEGARNLTGIPNTRKPFFDEDKCIFYDVTFGPQGNPVNIHPWNFNDNFENMEDMPQHLSPLMKNNQMDTMSMNQPMEDYITRSEFEELKEMLRNESATKHANGSNASNGGRNGSQQSGSKLNARTN